MIISFMQKSTYILKNSFTLQGNRMEPLWR